MILLLVTAFAAEPGHYDANTIAGESRAFLAAQDQVAPKYQQAREAAGAIAGALADHALALDALGDAAPPAARAALDEAWRQFGRDEAVVQTFAQAQVDGFDTAFTEAVERAAHGAVECERSRPLPGMPGRTVPSASNCPGADRSAEIARRIDADPALKRQLDALLQQPWPTFQHQPAPIAPVGAVPASAQVVDLSSLLHAGAATALRAIERADEEARLPIAAALESEPDDAALTRLRAEAAAVDAATAARRTTLAAPLLKAVAKRNTTAARKGQPVVVWCSQPAWLGGCTPSASEDALTTLLADPKVARALQIGTDAVTR